MADDTEASDQALLVRWRDGEREAGVVLVERHHESVARFFASKVQVGADDLVQATFLGLLDGALARFRDDASFRTFLFAIARNKLFEHLRGVHRDRARFDPTHSTLAGLGGSYSALIDARSQNKLLLAALRELPVDTQLMLELHYWEGMKIREIAEVLEVNPVTVRTRMHRGRGRLFEHMRALASTKVELDTTLHGLEGWAESLRVELGEGGESEGGA